MSYKTLIYISGTDSSVFSSQVISLLIELKEFGFFNRVILLAGIKKNQNSTSELERLLPYGFEVITFKLYPNYGFYSFLQTKEIQSALKRILTNNTIIHLRGETFLKNVNIAVENIKVKNVRIITDIRGANLDEIKLYLKNVYNPIKYWLKLKQAKKSIQLAGTCSNYISCVSESLSKYVIRKTNIKENRIGINHCIASKSFDYSEGKRNEFREKLGLKEDDILCVFVTGGNGPYQNTKRIVSEFLDKEVKVLNLSKTKIPGAINLFVQFNEVPGYLCAADIGIVWRNDDIVNNVASPVKFSEYVCCGLPVISNNGVHLIKDYIAETGNGKIVDRFEDIDLDMIKELMAINRNVISDIAQKQFSAKIVVENYISIYNELITLI